MSGHLLLRLVLREDLAVPGSDRYFTDSAGGTHRKSDNPKTAAKTKADAVRKRMAKRKK